MNYLKYAKLGLPLLAKLPVATAVAPTIWFLGVAVNETIRESTVRDEFAWREGLLKAADQMVLLVQWFVG